MNKTIFISLTGHPRRFELDEAAHERLAGYLERAAARLSDDPDRAEVLGDLERSVGDKLGVVIGSSGRLITTSDIDGVLEAIGAVEGGRDDGPSGGDAQPRRRRLQRIREGQQLAGVCTGLAAYSEIRVDWVRTLFVLGTVFTGGILGLVYIALAFILPVRSTREA